MQASMQHTEERPSDELKRWESFALSLPGEPSPLELACGCWQQEYEQRVQWII